MPHTYTERKMWRKMSVDEEEAYVSEILYGLPSKLCWRRPKNDHQLWVFWSPEHRHPTVSPSICADIPFSDRDIVTNHLEVHDKIITALSSFNILGIPDALLQFWAPTKIEGSRVLATSDQPFALHITNYMNDGLIQYRKHCLSYKCVVDVDTEEGDCPIARVFRNQLPEFSPDVSYYTDKEHPHCGLAVSCRIAQSFALPVFIPSQQCCVGVLELLLTKDFSHLVNGFVCRAKSALKVAGLKTIDTEHMYKQIDEGLGHVKDEIWETLKQVCKTHELPFACAWVGCTHSSVVGYDDSLDMSYNDSDIRSMRNLLVLIPILSNICCSMSFYDCQCRASRLLPIRGGQGLVGKAFSSHQPFLCEDVTELGINNYPMAHIVHELRYTGCIAFCLKSIATGSHDFVLEFFLSRELTHSEGLNNLCFSVLATLKRNLKSFRVAMGDLGKDFFIKVNSFCNNDFDSFDIRPAMTTQINSVPLENEGEDLHPDNDESDHRFDLAFEDFMNADLGPISLEHTEVTVPLGRKCLVKTPNQKKENSFPREILERHYGMKLKDAAKSLGVSRSTVKRWCRDNNIRRWPFPKRSKLCPMTPIPNQMNDIAQGNVEQSSVISRRDPKCSDIPTNLGPMQPLTVTVKARHGNDFIKFQLSLSSGMADLVEKVTLRLKLTDGTFGIKYLDEDGDHILITCDEDLLECMNSLRLSGTTTIKLLIEPIINNQTLD